MTPPESPAVAVELAHLRGEIHTGLADIKGSLGVLVERTSRTDADVKQLRADTEKDLATARDDVGKEIAALRSDVESLKRGRWPLATIGVLTGVGGAIAAGVALLQH